MDALLRGVYPEIESLKKSMEEEKTKRIEAELSLSILKKEMNDLANKLADSTAEIKTVRNEIKANTEKITSLDIDELKESITNEIQTDLCDKDKAELMECKKKLGFIESELMKENENISKKIEVFERRINDEEQYSHNLEKSLQRKVLEAEIDIAKIIDLN